MSVVAIAVLSVSVVVIAILLRPADRALDGLLAVGVVAEVVRKPPQCPPEGAQAVMTVEVVVAAAVPPDLQDLVVEAVLGAIDRVLELALAPRMAPDVPRELVECPAQGTERVGPVQIAVA